MLKKKYIIIILIIILISGLFIISKKTYFFQNIGFKILNSLKLKRLTIYEQNNHPEYPQTKIKIPEHQGYLIAVYKNEHKLKLYQDNRIIKEYNVNIKRELPDREVWEDNQTPEGIFTIETINKVTNGWARWMRLDTLNVAHPNYINNHPDGLERINNFEKKYNKIKTDADIKKFNSLNFDQKMLRGIGIHGGGFSLHQEWTWGCIAMSNKNVTELFNLLSQKKNEGLGTLVVVQV
ncbi:L,D-transpeptidase [bacterium]|nr:L,D-transpeptidase [bacterium]